MYKRQTNNILIKNVFDASFGAICWWFMGYPLAMGKDEGGVLGSSGFFMKGDDFIVDDSNGF